MVKPTFISLVPPPILAKSEKEVNEISKYFKKNTNSQQKKSYTNATRTASFKEHCQGDIGNQGNVSKPL